MDNLFDSYEQDFKQLVASVKDKLEKDGKEQRGEKLKATLRRVEMELDEADEMISQMEVEIHGMPQSVKGQFQTRVKNCKAELSRYKKQAKELHQSTTRTDLFSSGAPSDNPYGSSESEDQRARLLNGTQVLSDGTRRLEDSHRIALETEDVGADILRTLRMQRGQIEHTRDMLTETDTHIGRASGTLKGMIRRMHKQRIMTIGIVVVLVLIIGFILWAKLS